MSIISTAVIILNWNGVGHLQTYLPSVVAHSKDAEVIIADNASSDESVSWLKTHYPELRIIQLDKNYGFAGGYNKAIEQVNHDYIVLLNSDVEVTENWLAKPIELLDSNNKLAAIQPKILAHKEKHKFEYAGAAGGYMDKHYYAFCRGRLFDDLEEDKHQFDEDYKEVFWATGACLFVKRELYQETEGLDTDFFAHMEEIDLCYRLKNRGYSIGYTGKSTVYHLGGGTLKKVNPFKTYLNYRNNLYLIYKNHFHSSLFPLLFTRMILDGLSAGVKVTHGEWGNVAAIFKSHMHFYKALPSLIGKRKKLKAVLHQPNLTGLYQHSIIQQYFLKGVKTYQQLKSSF